MGLLLLLVAMGAASQGQAQVRLRTPDVRLEGRYDTIEEGALARRLQVGFRLRGGVDVGDRFSLIAFGATGTDFASRWSTLYDLRTSRAASDVPRVRLRRLYGQWRGPRYEVQLGAIPSLKASASPTTLDPDGWIDGGRVKWYLPGKATVGAVVGRIGEVKTTSVLARPFIFAYPGRADYAEVVLSQQIGPDVRAEASVEYLHDPYLRSELRWALGGGEVIGEVLYNTADAAVSVASSVTVDALASLGHPERMAFTLRHAYIDEAIGLRGRIADEFVTFGHSLTAVTEVVLSRRYGLEGEIEAIVSEGVGVEGLEGDVYTRLKVVLGWRWP